MSSPGRWGNAISQYAEAELSRAIRWLVQEEVGKEEPSDEVWDRIKGGLGGGPPAYPQPSWLAKMPRLAQFSATAIALLVVISAVLTSAYSSPSVDLIVVEYHEPMALVSEVPIVLSDEDALSSRQVYLRQRERQLFTRGLAPQTDPLLINRRWGG